MECYSPYVCLIVSLCCRSTESIISDIFAFNKSTWVPLISFLLQIEWKLRKYSLLLVCGSLKRLARFTLVVDMRQFYFHFILFKRPSIFTNHFIWVENENDFVRRWIPRCKCRFYYTLRRNDKWPKWSHHRRDLMTCFALNFIHSNDSFIHKPLYFRQRWMSRDSPHFMILVGESVYNRYQFLLLLLLLVQVNGDSQISIWLLLFFFQPLVFENTFTNHCAINDKNKYGTCMLSLKPHNGVSSAWNLSQVYF